MEDLGDTQDFDEDAVPDVVPPNAGKNSPDDEGNEYIVEVGVKSNNNSSPTLHVDILEYQVQKMNINQLKEKLGKIKTLYVTKKIFMKNFKQF